MPDPENGPWSGPTRKFQTPCGSLFVIVGYDREGQACYVSLCMGKAGGCVPLWAEALGRMMTLAVRSGANIHELLATLSGLRCDRCNAQLGGKHRACLDQMSEVLSDDCPPADS